MFRFWGQDARGSETVPGETRPASPQRLDTVPGEIPSDRPATPTSPAPAGCSKRRRLSVVDTSAHLVPSAKRARLDENGQLPSPTSASADPSADESEDADMTLPQPLGKSSAAGVELEHAKDVIEHQFGLEILLKHDELRLINQELAKCQVALEQLRRCHLIPYPLNCPTPDQMLAMSSGTGPALPTRPGHPVPQWAPPFGVVEGPYARHYAKWLIPDPKFDGVVPPSYAASTRHSKTVVAEGRTTRNSSDLGSTGKRPSRGMGQKLQALSSGYPQPKDKQNPCILKRSDGQTVKLICLDCRRWDFSSTQGFINHCRIAHRRDFKSHEEAAVHCGHPIEVDDAGGIIGDDHKPSVAAAPASGLVHPLARHESITEQQAYTALQSRISDSLTLYQAGHHPNVDSIPSAAPSRRSDSVSNPSVSFVGASDLPHLSSWMQKKNFKGNLTKHVRDAKTKLDADEDELLTPYEEWEDLDSAGASLPKNLTSAVARVPVSSVPAAADVSPPSQPAISASTKNRAQQPQFGFTSMPSLASSASGREDVETPMYEDDMEIDLSPNTMASNNAPSLVSDDGEYDDSDDGSSSETSESMDVEPESDVAEINIDEDEIAPAPLRRRGSTAVQLKKAESKHVTFVAAHIASNPKGRRKQQNI